ncbi:dph1 [Acrasis kona]|uniref:Dph1 n=1 Tax=Acrasis kona TaxID=1008807 RepID=A0AAW2Z4H4_9EUKA
MIPAQSWQNSNQQYYSQQHPQAMHPQQHHQHQPHQLQPPLQRQTLPKTTTLAKLYLPDNEIRRVSFDNSVDYARILQLVLPYVNQDLKEKDKVTTNSLKLYYLDDEQEYVRFDTPQEWAEVLPTLTFNKGPIKIKVTCTPTKEAKKEKSPSRKKEKKSQAKDKDNSDDSDVELVPVGAPLKNFSLVPPPSQLPVKSPPEPITSPSEQKAIYDKFRSSHHELLAQAPKRVDSPSLQSSQNIPSSVPVFPAHHYSMSIDQKFAPQVSQPIFKQVTSSTNQLPSAPQSVYFSELRELEGLGFNDYARNESLLRKHNGNVKAVLEEINGARSSQPQRTFDLEKSLKELNDMGFVETETNRTLLLKYKGDLSAVINELMS